MRVQIHAFEETFTQNTIEVIDPTGMRLAVIMSHDRYGRWKSDWNAAGQPEVVEYDLANGFLSPHAPG